MKTACRPAASAGLMSDLGLLPIIHVVAASQLVAGDERAVGGGVLLGQDFDGGEVMRQPERSQLVALLGRHRPW